MNSAVPFAVAVGAAVLVASLSGCDFGDVVRVKTPNGVQRGEGLAPSLTLNEAEHEYENWIATVRNDAMRWRADIDKADQISDMLAQFALQSLEDVGPTVSGVPVLGPALPLLTGLAGLMVRRPGDKSRVQTEAEKRAEADKAWDEATRAARELILSGKGQA